MSLGPPFDASGLRLQQAVGGGVVLALAAAVAWVLFMSGRELGPGVTFHVGMRAPGALRSGAKVRLAGQDVGEVRAIRFGDGGVDCDVFVERARARDVRANSSFFVATPSVLGEAYLEVGPPEGGAPPGPPVAKGAHLRAHEPPDIDDLLAHTERNLREILALIRENRPELDELLTAGDDLLATLSGLPADRGQLGRIRDQLVAAIDDGRALVGAVREAGGVERVRRLARDLGALADHASPELRDLGRRLDLALSRIDGLRGLFSDERRAQVEAAAATLRRAVATAEATAAEVRALAAYVERGEGTLGGFLADQELFDDLHETHRILKSQPWTLILKPQLQPTTTRPRVQKPAR